LKTLAAPTAIVAAILIFAAALDGELDLGSLTTAKLWGLNRYFAWCLFQEFGLQSFFTNRLSAIFKQPNRTAWASALVFGTFHIPNPVLIPVTFAGGYLLTRIFIKHRNLVRLRSHRLLSAACLQWRFREAGIMVCGLGRATIGRDYGSRVTSKRATFEETLEVSSTTHTS